MLFGVLSGVSRGMDVLDGGGDRQREGGSFGGESGASHCNQWGLLHSCAKVREQLLAVVRVLSGVGQGMGVRWGL